MAKIKTVIIDDEPKAIEVLKRYCDDMEIIEVEATFRDPVKAIEFIQHSPVNLILLDINMPKLSGLEFLDILNAKPKIIFTTAYPQFALNSYDYDAVDYLLKPIDFQRFLKAVIKAQKIIDAENELKKKTPTEAQNNKTIYIKSGPQLYKINVEDILYLEKDGNYLLFHTVDKKILSRQNMKDIFEILDPKDFIRVHKSYVVAIRHINVIEAHQLRMGNVKIPVGRNFREGLLEITGRGNK
ncbi:two component transcriptional regulator, LytTR family [Saccharicrinis carchari]|uniref:Two component transcriptional regulator, LytTR family n=1 Tax=Saccharicrinis carchari TaxID=1168039 RepID=A0A521ECC4_SACCC|nr:LytTR family DNA-binding domain-containing protein [Saccharicrinis carchari]SMO81586.1 two component transcriptional regulator, LytTR family [Saccharicrinis carchari]